ncbi:11534_t:CDS:2 [Entrophospora sp. SA101]|nr:11534_t:CDS:2 [Entrophospora sp. SA101]
MIKNNIGICSNSEFNNNIVTNTNNTKNKKYSNNRGPYVSRACENCKKSHRKCSEGNGSCDNCLRKNWECSKNIFIVQSYNDNGNNNNDDDDVEKATTLTTTVMMTSSPLTLTGAMTICISNIYF